MVVFFALAIAMFLGFAAVAVDVGYMYKSRRELQVASDAAALAGIREMATSSQSAARDKAYQYATANKLSGAAIPMDKANDVEFGYWSGKAFAGNVTPLNAVRVQLKKTTGTPQGPLALFFGRTLGMNSVQLQTQSIAVLSAIDLVMTLDWSTSMVNGTTWTKCTKCVMGQTPSSKAPWCGAYNTSTNYCSCGTTTSGILPFDTLQVAAANFVNDFNSATDQIAVQLFESTAVSPITQALTSSFSSVTSKIAGVADPTNCSMAAHSTNIADGMAKGIAELASARARASAAKVMVLLTDGQPTCTMSGSCNSTSATIIASGRSSALSQADVAAAAHIVIHTIGLGPDVDIDLLKQIATKTGGTYNFAATGNDLGAVFGDVRKRVPTQLVQ